MERRAATEVANRDGMRTIREAKMSADHTSHRATHINVWEDDPESAVQTSRPVPDVSHRPLAFSFPKPAPAPGTYDPRTAEFRYWTAAEALRRGADFWAPLLPVQSWQP